MASHRSFLLLCYLSWNGDEFSSRGSLLCLHIAELSAGFKKPERSSSNADDHVRVPQWLTRCLMELRLQLFSLIFYALHRMALKAFLASQWGRKEGGLSRFIMTSCFCVCWYFCSWSFLGLKTRTLLCLLGELVFILEEQVPVLVCSLPDRPPRQN